MIRNSREGEGDVVGSEIQELVLCRRELGLETEAVLAEWVNTTEGAKSTAGSEPKTTGQQEGQEAGS